MRLRLVEVGEELAVVDDLFVLEAQSVHQSVKHVLGQVLVQDSHQDAVEGLSVKY